MKRLGLFALMIAAGCAKTDSSSLLTSGMHASMSARAMGDGTTVVRATLFVGNPLNLNYVELTGDDQLLAGHGGQFKPMIETITLNVVSHRASFDTDAEGDRFDVRLVRSVDSGAPDSYVTLPPPLTLDPLTTTTVSRASALTLSWAPGATSYAMRWEVQGDCIEQEYQDLATDTGSLTIEANRIKKRMGDGVPDTCDATVEVSRIDGGVVDDAYGAGGTFVGSQTRALTFTTTP